MRHELRLFLVALQFLTRVPIPRRIGFEPDWLQQCVRHFPGVGALVGAWGAAVLWGGLQMWPALVASAVSLVATVWLTGAFHEDGLADTCDGLGGVADRERALAIMKDSRIGSYGAVALVLALGLKVIVVGALAVDVWIAAAALVWSHAASRAAAVLVMTWLPYAGDAEHAKAKPLATRVDGYAPVGALAWMVVVSAACSALPIDVRVALPVVVVAVAIATVACRRWLRRRLGGFTGDTLGATQQIVEAVALLAWLAVAGRAHG